MQQEHQAMMQVKNTFLHIQGEDHRDSYAHQVNASRRQRSEPPALSRQQQDFSAAGGVGNAVRAVFANGDASNMQMGMHMVYPASGVAPFQTGNFENLSFNFQNVVQMGEPANGGFVHGAAMPYAVPIVNNSGAYAFAAFPHAGNSSAVSIHPNGGHCSYSNVTRFMEADDAEEEDMINQVDLAIRTNDPSTRFLSPEAKDSRQRSEMSTVIPSDMSTRQLSAVSNASSTSNGLFGSYCGPQVSGHLPFLPPSGQGTPEVFPQTANFVQLQQLQLCEQQHQQHIHQLQQQQMHQLQQQQVRQLQQQQQLQMMKQQQTRQQQRNLRANVSIQPAAQTGFQQAGHQQHFQQHESLVFGQPNSENRALSFSPTTRETDSFGSNGMRFFGGQTADTGSTATTQEAGLQHGMPSCTGGQEGDLRGARLRLQQIQQMSRTQAKADAAKNGAKTAQLRAKDKELRQRSDAVRWDQGVVTVMLRQVPRHYSQLMMLAEVNRRGFQGLYDFFYLPFDLKKGINVGFGFVSFTQPKHALAFRKEFDGLVLDTTCLKGTCKPLHVHPASVQGYEANFQHFSATKVWHKQDPQFSPLFFPNGQALDVASAGRMGGGLSAAQQAATRCCSEQVSCQSFLELLAEEANVNNETLTGQQTEVKKKGIRLKSKKLEKKTTASSSTFLTEAQAFSSQTTRL